MLQRSIISLTVGATHGKSIQTTSTPNGVESYGKYFSSY